jgi:arylsulfatase
MTRRHFLASSAVAFAAPRVRPNIVFVLTDDQGYGDLSCHGNPILQTPHLDGVHRESVRFTDFHASPTCAPTRTALMTGRHEFRSGVTHTILERERMSLKATTIAQVLKDAGYTSGIFGKWHLGDAEPYQPIRRGFDEVFIHGCGGIGQQYPGTCSDVPGNSYFDPVIRHNNTFVKTEGYCTDVFFNQAMRWIGDRAQTRQPFFAYITPNAPHTPLDCPEDYIKRYAGKVDEKTARYFGMVANIDDNVGRLLAKLEELKIDRNTLFVFMTDNGGTGGVRVFNAGMRGAKGTPYNGGTRVPAFFRWRGTLAPGDRGQLAAHIDIFPTLAGLAGAKIPGPLRLDGRSLLKPLRNPRAAWPDRYLFTHVGRWEKGRAADSKYAKCSVRSARFNMVNSTPEKQWELYDLQADRSESTNVAAQFPKQLQRMESAYDEWWQQILPALENEDAVPPAVAPYRALWEAGQRRS